VDTTGAKASYDAGVLTISLAKKEAAKPKQVKIEVGSGSTAPQAKQVEGTTSAAA
jgi:HSP20 family protein